MLRRSISPSSATRFTATTCAHSFCHPGRRNGPWRAHSATRELAQSIGLNGRPLRRRSTFWSRRLIRREVGRGSFVTAPEAPETIRFSVRVRRRCSSSGRVSRHLREVIDSEEAAHICSSSAGGYGPLRRYLMDEARKRGTARADDDVVVTSGCQQAFDLIQRVLASRAKRY